MGAWSDPLLHRPDGCDAAYASTVQQYSANRTLPRPAVSRQPPTDAADSAVREHKCTRIKGELAILPHHSGCQAGSRGGVAADVDAAGRSSSSSLQPHVRHTAGQVARACLLVNAGCS